MNNKEYYVKCFECKGEGITNDPISLIASDGDTECPNCGGQGYIVIDLNKTFIDFGMKLRPIGYPPEQWTVFIKEAYEARCNQPPLEGDVKDAKELICKMFDDMFKSFDKSIAQKIKQVSEDGDGEVPHSAYWKSCGLYDSKDIVKRLFDNSVNNDRCKPLYAAFSQLQPPVISAEVKEDKPIDLTELRDKFYSECTRSVDKETLNSTIHEWDEFIMQPYDVWEWFEPYISKPVEGDVRAEAIKIISDKMREIVEKASFLNSNISIEPLIDALLSKFNFTRKG